MSSASRAPVRCGIILAAGEGKRLRPFIHRLWGEVLPKQYVNFIGTGSMLEHTISRVEKLIPADRLFTVVSRQHLRHFDVQRQLAGRPQGTVVVQPENKETGPGLLLPLMHLYKRYPESTVAVFPTDHFIMEEDLFMAYVDLAFGVVERDPARLVLLGMEPDEPEPEYGYILPGEKVQDLYVTALSVHTVLQFIEKPPPDAARELVQKGGLWNTLVLICKAKTLVDLAQGLVPALYRSFHQIWEAIGTPDEIDVVEEAYHHMASLNFSKAMLEVLPRRHPSHLLVLPVQGVFWSDVGSEQRIVSVLRRMGWRGPLPRTPEKALQD